MKSLLELVHVLVETKENHTPLLQKINEEILKNYQVSIGDYLTITAKEIEIYYVNRNVPNTYVDMNMHCMLDPKTNNEIWQLQSNRYGQLYIHRKGMGGADICLSDSSDFALCCTLKAAYVNGEELWSGVKIRDYILEIISEHEQLVDKEATIAWINDKHSITQISPRKEVSSEIVYHIRRNGLRRRDKHTLQALCSFVDLWNKKQRLNSIQKVNLYMETHPEENVLNVLREHEFRYIPLEIKIRYKLDRKAKLYE